MNARCSRDSRRPTGSLSLVLGLLVCSLGAASTAWAGTLDVNNIAAFDGTFGLQVTVEETCPWPDNATLNAPPMIQGLFAGCKTLTATAVEVIGAGATFQADEAVILENDFSVADDADFTVILAPPVSDFAWLTDDTPAAQTMYMASYRLNLNPLSLGTGDVVTNLAGLSADLTTHFEVRIKRNAAGTEDRLIVRARENDGALVETPPGGELLLPAGYNLIELVWVAGVGNGYLQVAVNGSVFTGLTGLENYQGRIDSVRWGAVSGMTDSTSGSLLQDAFTSH